MSDKNKLTLKINPIVVSVGPDSPPHRVHTDKNNNDLCYYCGYGPSNPNPKWKNGMNCCTLTHKYSPREKAFYSENWEKHCKRMGW